MSLHVYRSNRTEVLLARMAEVLDRERLSPLHPEHIVVDGRGMERWLALQLARRNGICANTAFVFPRSIVLRALDSVLGEPREGAAGAAPGAGYEPEVMLWAVAEVLPSLLGLRVFEPVRAYLGEAGPGSRRLLALCERIARTFDDYVVYRPQMVLRWQRDPRHDAELAAGQRWQPPLWRALVESLGDDHVAARAGRYFDALDRGGLPEASFPARLCLFGLSTLAPLYLRILTAMERGVDLHLFVLEPCRQFWSDIVDRRRAFAIARRQGRSEDELHLEVGHPLLASLGKQGRDHRIVLDEVEAAGRVDHEAFEAPEAVRMLHVLQADVLDLRERRVARGHGQQTDTPTRVEPLPLLPDDESVAVHSCHSPMREVEVLYDQLLALLGGDPSLLPSDVVVMAPQIDEYAPAIDAVFGGAPEDGRIRYSLADRGTRATHGVVDAFFKLLDALHGRMAAPEVMDLLACEPIRSRFGITPSDLPQLRDWIEDSGIRWAADAAHRGELGHPARENNTWRSGLQRLLLGIALPGAASELFAGVLPSDRVEGADLEMVGRLAEFCSVLFAFRRRVQEAMPAAQWQAELAELVDACLRTTDDDEHQRGLLLDAFAALAERAGIGGYEGRLELEPVRAQLQSMLEAGRSTGGFVAGGVTFCSTVPMRAIPFRVVCLLGMNDGSFPRNVRALGFDLLGERPLPGDRSVRDDDRYLFLEALLSARDRLIVTYCGQSIRDNSTKPPAVVVSELLDVLEESFYLPECAAQHAAGSAPMRHLVRSRLVVEHPLQPFSPRYFGADPDPRLFSHSPYAAEVARALADARIERAPFVDGALPEDERLAASVTLEDLSRYFRRPTATYLRHALGIRLAESESPLADTEPMELDGLDRWKICDAMLSQLTAGRTCQEVEAIARAGGRLPPAAPGEAELESDRPVLEELARTALDLRDGAMLDGLEVAIELGGTLLSGVVRERWPAGIVRLQYSRSAGKHLFDLWLCHLALNCVAPPDVARTSYLVGRDPKSDKPALTVLEPVEGARERLHRLVEIYLLGHRVPLPLFPNASWAWAQELTRTNVRKERDPQARLLAARKEARSGYRGNAFSKAECDLDDAAVRQVFGELDPLRPGFRAAPLPGVDVPDFEGLAEEVCVPVLRCVRKERP